MVETAKQACIKKILKPDSLVNNEFTIWVANQHFRKKIEDGKDKETKAFINSEIANKWGEQILISLYLVVLTTLCGFWLIEFHSSRLSGSVVSHCFQVRLYVFAPSHKRWAYWSSTRWICLPYHSIHSRVCLSLHMTCPSQFSWLYLLHYVPSLYKFWNFICSCPQPQTFASET